MSTVADHIALVLKRHGVEHIFGQSIPSQLLLAAERQGIRQVMYRAENAGGAMADGYARVSHRVGVVAAQNGPAATLLVAPLAEALKASVPVLALVQEVPRRDRGRNAFQELDHEALFSGVAKWVVRLDEPTTIESDLVGAMRRACSERPGPVVVLIPRDVLAAPAPALSRDARDARPARSDPRDVLAAPAPAPGPSRDAGPAGTDPLDTLATPAVDATHEAGIYPLDRPRPARAAIEQAAELLARAERPVVVAGGGVHLSDASGALAVLQEVASLPVATTTMGKGAVDEGHELSIGVVGSFMGANSYTRSLRPLVADADVILLVGTRTNENGTDGWTLFPEGATYLHLDMAAEEVGRNYDSVRLVGDARSGLEDLVEQLRRVDLARRAGRRPEVVAQIAAGHLHDRVDAETVTRSDRSPIRPERVMSELDRLLDSDDIVVTDASYATVWAAAYLRARRAGQRFITPRGLAGLGWGLPMALGAKAARPEQTVVCLVGDGAFAHTWAEMETAVRESLPLTIILLNNGILAFQKHAELHQWGAHTSAVTFGPVDHVAIARACGALGLSVDDPDDLAPVLAEALASEVATLIEVIIDPFAHPPITAWDGSEALLGHLTAAGE